MEATENLTERTFLFRILNGGLFLKMCLKVMTIPIRMFGKYSRSMKLRGLGSSTFTRFVSGCIFLYLSLVDRFYTK